MACEVRRDEGRHPEGAVQASILNASCVREQLRVRGP